MSKPTFTLFYGATDIRDALASLGNVGRRDESVVAAASGTFADLIETNGVIHVSVETDGHGTMVRLWKQDQDA